MTHLRHNCEPNTPLSNRKHAHPIEKSPNAIAALHSTRPAPNGAIYPQKGHRPRDKRRAALFTAWPHSRPRARTPDGRRGRGRPGPAPRADRPSRGDRGRRGRWRGRRTWRLSRGRMQRDRAASPYLRSEFADWLRGGRLPALDHCLLLPRARLLIQ
jgi:hypothetical protein